MKHFVLIFALCLLAGVSEGTFELEDPARIIEEDENTLTNETPDGVTRSAAKKIIVPPGVNLVQPLIENNECVSFSSDLSQTTAKGEAVGYTTRTYLGVVRSTIECPLNGSDAEARLKIALIETEQGPLFWVDSSRILDVKYN